MGNLKFCTVPYRIDSRRSLYWPRPGLTDLRKEVLRTTQHIREEYEPIIYFDKKPNLAGRYKNLTIGQKSIEEILNKKN